MTAPAVRGIDLFKIAGRSISGWIPSFKTGAPGHVRQPFCSHLEGRLLLCLEYHPQVAWYARGDISAQFAQAYRLPTPKEAPFAIGYVFDGTPHEYLPDVVGTLTDGRLLIAEAGMEDDKRQDRNLAKAEAACRLARRRGGSYWIGTEQRLTAQHHYNLVFLHARRLPFPDCAAIEAALHQVWPFGEVACVEEVARRLEARWPTPQVEAALWKMIAEAAAQGHLLLDLAQVSLNRLVPLALLPPHAPPMVPDPFPDTLLPAPVAEALPGPLPVDGVVPGTLVPGPPFDASTLSELRRERFVRNLRAVEQVLAGAQLSETARRAGMAPSGLSRLVQRTRELGQIACVPYGGKPQITAKVCRKAICNIY